MAQGANSPTRAAVTAESPGLRPWVAWLVIAGAVLAAYANSFTLPFFFDDRHSIVENPTIRHFSTALLPPTNSGPAVRGRPLVNLSFALNYALGGLDVRGYHALNLFLHVASALTLYGLVRRTLRRPPWSNPIGCATDGLALVAAVLWAVHPLLTESVDCVVQRTETLAALLYLLTLYGLVRAVEPGGSSRWLAFSVAACLLGVMAKEILATAPLVVILYDYVFVGGSLAGAWRQRRGYYLALLATWLPLGALILWAQGRGGTVGFETGMAWWQYAFTQCGAVVHYLWLSVWPYPLVVDYGVAVTKSFAAVWPQALLLAALGAGTLVALRRRHAAGFLGAAFFLLLAPSSSVIPLTTQTVAEHRMYLPLAAVVLLAVAGVHAWLGRRGLILLWLWAAALATGTFLRNADYRTELSIWGDTVRRVPENPRAHYNLAVAQLAAGDRAGAEPHLREALRLSPGYTDAHLNLGQLLLETGRPAEAAAELARALELRPDSFPGHLNLATALTALGRAPEAVAHFESAVRLQPESGLANFGLGSAFAATGRLSEAIGPLQAAARLLPESAPAHLNLASALAALGRATEAGPEFEAALRLDPGAADAHFNYGLLLARAGDLRGAQRQLEQALQLRPGFGPARDALQQVNAQLAANPAGR